MIFSSFFPTYYPVMARRVLLNLPLLLLTGLLILPIQVTAQPLELVDIAKKLQSTYEKASTLVADFDQTTSMQFSSRIRQGSGSMLFFKPGFMRWDYITPDHQVLTSNGISISMYFEKSNQMIISDAKDYLQSDVTYSFFTGTGDILKDFDILEPDFINTKEETHLIKLVPKSSHPHVSSIHAWITDKTFLLERLRIVDHFETITDLYFKSVQIDSDSYDGREISKKLFSFMPPANTEIIEQY